jgi:hypothetical protein
VTSTDPGPGRLARIFVTLALVGSSDGCYKEPVAITTYPPSDVPAAGDPSESS